MKEEIEALQVEIKSLSGEQNVLKTKLTLLDKRLTKLSSVILADTTHKNNVDQIWAALVLVTGLSEKKIKESSRERNVVEARQVASAIIRHNTDLSLEQIGKLICRKPMNHATVLHGVKQVENALDLHIKNGVVTPIAKIYNKCRQVLDARNF